MLLYNCAISKCDFGILYNINFSTDSMADPESEQNRDDRESEQLWRVMNGKLISKHRRNLKRLKPAVLTLEKEGTVAAMNPNINKDQSWTLVKKEWRLNLSLKYVQTTCALSEVYWLPEIIDNIGIQKKTLKTSIHISFPYWQINPNQIGHHLWTFPNMLILHRLIKKNTIYDLCFKDQCQAHWFRFCKCQVIDYYAVTKMRIAYWHLCSTILMFNKHCINSKLSSISFAEHFSWKICSDLLGRTI